MINAGGDGTLISIYVLGNLRVVSFTVPGFTVPSEMNRSGESLPPLTNEKP